jgi:uncharacterized protein involved in exopolysaccharide biosynthesis
LLLKPSRELKTLDPANPEDSRSGINSGTLMRSELEILKTRELAEIVVENVGVEKILEPYQKPTSPPGLLTKALILLNKIGREPTSATETLMSATHSELDLAALEQARINYARESAIRLVQGGLQPTARETLLTLSFTGPNPEYCREMLQAVLEAHQKRRVEVYRVSPDTFVEKTEEIYNELKETEEEFQQYLAKLGITSLEEAKAMLQSQVAYLESAITESSVVISASEARVAGVEKIASLRQMGISADEREDPFSYYLRRDLTSLMIREAELSSRYPDNAIPLKNVRTQIERLVSILSVQEASAESTQGAPPLINNATATYELEMAMAHVELDSEAARKNSLEKVLEYTEARLAELEKHELPVKRMSRKLATLERSYAAYSAGLQKAEASAALDNEMISNISIIESPTLPLAPDTKLRTRILAFSAFFAFFGSLGFALVLNFMDHSLKTAEEVQERLGLQVLATFPRTRRHRIRVSSQKRIRPETSRSVPKKPSVPAKIESVTARQETE